MTPHLLTESQARMLFPADAVVVRQRRGVGDYLGALVFFAIAVGLLSLPWWRDLVPHTDGWVTTESGWRYRGGKINGPNWLFISIGLIFFLIAKAMWNDIRRAAKPSAWLMAFSRDKIWLKVRSYKNASWSQDDKIVLQLERYDVDRVQPRQGTVVEGSGDNRHSKTVSQLWMQLRDSLEQNLVDAVLLENTRMGGGTIKSRSNDYPVQLGKDGRSLCISFSRVAPSFQEVIEALRSRGVLVEALAGLDDTQLLPNRRAMTPAIESEIERLAKQGQKIEAIRLLRDCSGLGLKEAKDAIEQGRWSGKS